MFYISLAAVFAPSQKRTSDELRGGFGFEFFFLCFLFKKLLCIVSCFLAAMYFVQSPCPVVVSGTFGGSFYLFISEKKPSVCSLPSSSEC